MVFSADNLVLIKLSRQKQEYGAKMFITEFFQQAVDTVRIKQTVA